MFDWEFIVRVWLLASYQEVMSYSDVILPESNGLALYQRGRAC